MDGSEFVRVKKYIKDKVVGNIPVLDESKTFLRSSLYLKRNAKLATKTGKVFARNGITHHIVMQ